MARSVASCLRSVGYDMPRVFDVMPLLDIDGIVEALTIQLQDVGSVALYCPREAPTRGVVSCIYEQWLRPYSLRRRYCHLPVSGRGMQRFLQFRLGCHSLPIAAGRLAGAAHVTRAHRACLACNSGAVGAEMLLATASPSVQCCSATHADSSLESLQIYPIDFCCPYRREVTQHHCTATLLLQTASPTAEGCSATQAVSSPESLQVHIWTFAVRTGVKSSKAIALQHCFSKLHHPLLRATVQHRVTAALSHCKYTYGHFLSIQV